MYEIIDEHLILRLEDRAYIPVDTNNPDYEAYSDWRSKGNSAPNHAIPPIDKEDIKTKEDLELAKRPLIEEILDRLTALEEKK